MARQRPGTAFPRREQWSASRTGEGLGSARSVDRVFETLACLELWLLRGGDLEGLAGAGVATLRGCALANIKGAEADRLEEHTSELQSHSFISYAVFCLKKKKK